MALSRADPGTGSGRKVREDVAGEEEEEEEEEAEEAEEEHDGDDEEQRIDPHDGGAYRKEEFVEHYG